MKEIKVLGGGCASCKVTARIIEQVAHERNVPIHLTKVEDYREIASFNVLTTPGVVLDGQVVHAGGVPSRAKVESWF